MNKKAFQISVCLLAFLISHSLISQNHLYNYAIHPETVLSAEFLNNEMLLNTIDNQSKWKETWIQNKWYHFEFQNAIHIEHLEIDFYNPKGRDTYTKEYVQLRINLSDTSFVFKIDEFSSILKIAQKSKFVTISSELEFHHITEIKIKSKTRPPDTIRENPRIDLKRKKRIEISENIKRFTKQKSKSEKKFWRKRIKFYKKHILNKAKKYQRAIYSRNEYDFCYALQYDLDHLSNDKVIYANDKCGCNLNVEFFNRNIKATPALKRREFKFLGEILSYNMDSTENILVEYLNNGDAWAGHAIPHLCLMEKKEYVYKIDSLKNDKNVFTQAQVVKGLLYFEQPKKALAVSKNIFNNEWKSLDLDSTSLYRHYAWQSLTVMNEYYPNEIMPLLFDLFLKYKSLHPKKSESTLNRSIEEIYQNKVVNENYNFHGIDTAILNYVKSYLKKYPHLSNNSVVSKFLPYINECSSP